MPSSVRSLWNSPDVKPPTAKDSAMREKHVRESVPYNSSHATEHMKSIVEQLQKLSVIDRPGASKLASGAGKRLGNMLKKISKYGAKGGAHGE